jgi:hypothetical protein
VAATQVSALPTTGVWAEPFQANGYAVPIADVMDDIALRTGVAVRVSGIPESPLTFRTQDRSLRDFLTQAASVLGLQWTQDGTTWVARRSPSLAKAIAAAERERERSRVAELKLIFGDLQTAARLDWTKLQTEKHRLERAREATIASASPGWIEKSADLADQLARLNGAASNPAAYAIGRALRADELAGKPFARIVRDASSKWLQQLPGGPYSSAVVGYGFDGVRVGGRLVAYAADGKTQTWEMSPLVLSTAWTELEVAREAANWANTEQLPAWPKGSEVPKLSGATPLDRPLLALAEARRQPLVVAADLARSTFVLRDALSINDALTKTEGYYRSSDGWLLARSREFWRWWGTDPTRFRVDLLKKSDFSMENLAGFITTWPSAADRLASGSVLLPIDAQALGRAIPALEVWASLSLEQRAQLRDRAALPWRSLGTSTRAALRRMFDASVANSDLQSSIFADLMLASTQGQFEDFELYFDQMVDPQYEYTTGDTTVTAPIDMTPVLQQRPEALRGRRRQTLMFGLDANRCVRVSVDVPLIR